MQASPNCNCLGRYIVKMLVQDQGWVEFSAITGEILADGMADRYL